MCDKSFKQLHGRWLHYTGALGALQETDELDKKKYMGDFEASKILQVQGY